MRISDWSSDVCSSDLQLSICIRFKLRLKFFSFQTDAGWSSLAARRAHNPKVVGSNPAPATSTLKPANCAMQLAGFDLGRKFRAGNLRTKNIALRAQNIAGKPDHEKTSSKRRADRKRVEEGKRVSVRVDLGGCRNSNTTNLHPQNK